MLETSFGEDFGCLWECRVIDASSLFGGLVVRCLGKAFKIGCNSLMLGIVTLEVSK